MQRFDIINNLIKEKGYKPYLEIGVQNGVCFENIACEKKIGVDPRANVPVDCKMTSDAFFAQNKERFDCILIDGLHTFEQSLDRKSTRLNSSHSAKSRMPSSA